VADECGLTLIGYIAFLDPRKESAAPALKKLEEHGITVKVLTGDNELVMAQVCRQVGLVTVTVMLGSQIELLSDEALKIASQQHRVFAKRPFTRSASGLPCASEATLSASWAMASTMRQPCAADIGISVDSAVDIVKEAADIILLEKSLMVLDDGVVEGRTTFCNMQKYIRMTAS
jgi:Mg2+-importing ATPase